MKVREKGHVPNGAFAEFRLPPGPDGDSATDILDNALAPLLGDARFTGKYGYDLSRVDLHGTVLNSRLVLAGRQRTDGSVSLR